MVSMKDIAKACGVSVATVSKALSGQPDIGEQTRELICRTADSLGYMTNSAARALKTNRTYNIGVLFVDERRSGLAHEYFSAVLESLKVEAEANGYDITFINRNVGKKATTYLQHCQYRGVDGVVIACVDFNDPQVLELVNSRLPVVTIDHVFNNRAAVVSDNVRGMEELVRYVYAKGHRRIAALTADPDDSSISQLRYSGYARALRELGIPPEEEDVICADDFTVESGCRAMRERLKRPADFTAVFAIADDMAIGAMRALRESGRSIPEDCSIIAIDGINVSEYIHPMLTTLCQPMTAMGTKSVELLLGVIRGGAHDHLTLPTTLRAGESVRDLTK